MEGKETARAAIAPFRLYRIERTGSEGTEKEPRPGSHFAYGVEMVKFTVIWVSVGTGTPAS